MDPSRETLVAPVAEGVCRYARLSSQAELGAGCLLEGSQSAISYNADNTGEQALESENNNVEASEGPRRCESVQCLLRYLYVGHFLARWGARMWEFAVGLFMIHILPDSLVLAALYGLIESAAIALLGVAVGDLVDRISRLKVLRTWLLLQNICYVSAALGVVFLLLKTGKMSATNGPFVVLIFLINGSGAVAALASLSGTILVERDWVVVIAESEGSNLLTRTNAILRRVDLSCKLLAPIVVGMLMSFMSVLASAIFIAMWNIISVGLEYWLLLSVYNGFPALQTSKPKQVIQPQSTVYSEKDAEFVEVPSDSLSHAPRRKGNEIMTFFQKFLHIPVINGWSTYMQQEVVLAGLSLAILHFTVLSFGTLMTAVLEWKGVPPYGLSLARGFAAAVGICATMLYPRVQEQLQTVRTGLWSIWLQWSLLTFCVASIWVHNEAASAGMLMGGVALSRLGLWMFDLSVIQQMQDLVPETDRGVVGGVQNSLQSIMGMLSYVVGITISNPKDFGWPILMSFGAVTTAAVVYSVHVYHIRKHLFHFDLLLRKFQ